MNTETFHDTPADTYARLVALFGESNGSSVGAPDTFWVTFGAGTSALTFFPSRDYRREVRDDG